jgi:LytR cell envelope-related transcriptional attenuator
VDAPLTPPDALIRPWRLATLAASLIAGIELVLLIVLAFVLLAKPLSRAIQHHASAVATAPAKTHATHVVRKVIKTTPPTQPKLARSAVHVLVLNGNGRAGAAHVEASRLQSLGYRIGGATNAKRSDYATTVVMYRPGFSGEGHRLARDLHVAAVGPLDGIKATALHGSQAVVVVGN